MIKGHYFAIDWRKSKYNEKSFADTFPEPTRSLVLDLCELCSNKQSEGK